MAIYKSGQGYWTRIMSATGFGLLTLLGAVWLYRQIYERGGAGVTVQYAAAGAALIFGLAGFLFIYIYCGLKPRSVDFLVATEGEMKKVNWSTRREVMGSTLLVIIISGVIAGFCALLDVAWAALMTAIGVLQPQ